MAIKLTPNPTFRAKVTIQPPGDGKPFDIDCEFRHKTAAERETFLAAHKFDLDAVQEVLVGWKDKDVEFSEETLAVLLDNYPGAASEFLTVYLRELAGARRGN